MILESGKRLSESLLWRLQEEAYDSAGIAAWNEIPYYATSNPFIAEAYAELIVAFLLDHASRLDPSEPVYILEMAAGTGCFGFYLLKSLLAKKAYFHILEKLSIRYVMSDFAEKNVEFWEQHPLLQSFHGTGLLDYAVFRPEEESRLLLRASRTELNAGSVRNPVIAIANYFFDSLRQDIFRIRDHTITEGQITLHYDGELPGEEPLRIERIRKEETYVAAEWDYYPDPELNAVLRSYGNRFDDATILFPLGAFRCIRNLRALSSDRLALLTSDKAFLSEDYLKGELEHQYSLHGPVFSYAVNFDAIRDYFSRAGSTTFTTADETHFVLTMLNVLLQPPPPALENCRYYFEEKIAKQNLINNFYQLQDALSSAPSTDRKAVLQMALAAIRISDFDPITFYVCAEKILDSVASATGEQRESLIEILEKVGGNIYIFDRGRDVLFWLGRFYYALGMFDECSTIFRGSMKILGPDDQAWYYLGACSEAQGDYAAARNSYTQAHLFDPECELTGAAVRRMEQALASGAKETSAEA